jgi:hypothetical protein
MGFLEKCEEWPAIILVLSQLHRLTAHQSGKAAGNK